jgi:hypothetical protein
MEGCRPGVIVVLAVLVCGLIAGWVAGLIVGYLVISPWLQSREVNAGGFDCIGEVLIVFLTAVFIAPFGAVAAGIWMLRLIRRQQP